MPLYILTETAAGYALLKARDKKLLDNDDIAKDTDTAEKICAQLKLKSFQKFSSAATALEEVSALVDGKVSSRLSDLLNQLKDEKKAALAVADPKLANAIKKLPNLSITPISDASTAELYRSIRAHLSSLIPGLLPDDVATMSLGLSHSLSRHKLRFSPDKVDTMIVQAIALLDDLDKELNTYAMRAKEWYGWHFPEMGKIVNDNLAYSRIILKMGLRTNAASSDLADILPEEIETAVKAAAEVSMGTEISIEDLDNIQALAEQVVNFTEYRQQLSSYLSSRMLAIAPNLTALVGELVGARLIAHAGSLMNLAKSPASTIQILGAEKALFRALKTKHDTPKYGLIYHASLVGQATGKNKGKIARVLAAKAAIGIRVDALADWGLESTEDTTITDEERASLGIESRLRIERKLAALEGRALRPKGTNIAPTTTPTSTSQKWVIKEAQKYNQDADGVAIDAPPAKREKHAVNGTTNGEAHLLSQTIAAIPSASDDASSSSDDDVSEQNPVSVDPVLSNAHKPPRQKGPTPKEAQKIAKRLRREKRLAARAERKAEKAVKRAKKEQFKKHRVENMISSALNGNKEPSVIAMALGMSTKKYLRKVEKGSIKFNENGIPLKLFEVAKTGAPQKDTGPGKRKLEDQATSNEPPEKRIRDGSSE